MGERLGQRQWLGAFALVAGLSLGPSAFADKGKGGPPMEVQGHRGARALRPENTLAAFEYALEVGVDVLELDLVVSKDDQLVVAHDLELNPELCLREDGSKLSGPGPAFRSLRLAEIQRYDCGSLIHPRFPTQKPVPKTTMPTLEAVFDLVRRSKHPAAARVGFNIETKSVPGHPELSPSPARFAELVVRAIEKSGFIARCNLQSFDHRTLIEAQKLNPKLRRAALISDNWVDHVAVARAVSAEIVSPDKEWITKEAVDLMHAAKLRVIPWTANREDEWQRLVEIGVDGIITDDPAGLIRFLERIGRR